MKVTACAPSNIAFIKYWGKTDSALRIPTNTSISMNLSGLLTTTTVEFSSDYHQDDIWIDGKQEEKETARVHLFLDRIRQLAGITTSAKVVSTNSFPSGTGLSSSASGFAALTVAATRAAGLQLSEEALTRLARMGSGSACRSIPAGFVEWTQGTDDATSIARSIYPATHWSIADVVAIVSDQKKEVSTSQGQERANSSPFFPVRLERLPDKVQTAKRLLEQRTFMPLGELIEAEALELHAVMMTSIPPLLYLLPQTILVMREVQTWRRDGLAVYFTLNTGQDVHCICQKQDVPEIAKRLQALPVVRQIIINEPCEGAHVVETL